jgi:hypothetical protein
MPVTRLRIGCLLLLVAMFAPLANADSVPGTDPRIIINDPICSSIITVTSSQFAFQANASGQGVVCLTNATGMDLINLSIDVIQPPGTNFPSDFQCGGDAFMNCVFTLNGNILNILFSGVNSIFLGIPAGNEFLIDLTAPEGGGGWGTNAQFSATANAVPEPGTLSLFLAGLGTLVARRRMRKGARS